MAHKLVLKPVIQKLDIVSKTHLALIHVTEKTSM